MNNLTLTGVLGKDSELRSTPSGDNVLSFSVADSQGREKITIWWNCQLWGKRAASLQQYLTKGQAVTVAGSVSEREWTDKEGQKRKSMDVRVNDVALQGGRSESALPVVAAAKPVAKPVSAGSGFDDMSDDFSF